MNNHSMNNFMNSQTPQISSLVSQVNSSADSNSVLGQQCGGGDTAAPASEEKMPSGGANAGGAGDLDNLQQDFSRPDRGSQHHPIAEFLYQLTKMLTDDNGEIIEWVDGRIKVHHPERLESEVLHKYFRHSKFASFQRQLNYFGFRKIAGKGKMSPCSYVNEAATSDIRSLLLIKRKTNGSAARKAAMAQRQMPLANGANDLRANLSALAAGVAGAQPGARLNAPVLSNAAALLQENAARAGLGQFQLTGMQQKGLGGNLGGNLFLPNDNTAMSLLMSGQGQQDDSRQQNVQTKTPSAPSLEQLHAQLAASLAGRQQNSVLNPSALSASALNLAAMPATAALNLAGSSSNESPASAALNAQSGAPSSAMPATAAMNAATAAGQTNNLFDSATNLKSLINEHPGLAAGLNVSHSGQGLLNRLPSSNTIFPENLSTASFGNLLASSNRISSLLSLNNLLSRDPSMADLMLPNGTQFSAANGIASIQQANNFRGSI